MLTTLKERVFSTRILKFGTVGASGVFVNMGCLYLLTEFVGLPYFFASVFAIELAILSNFTINYLWTWADRRESGTFRGKIIRYHIAMGMTGYAGNYLILIVLTEVAGLHYLVSNLIGIGVATMINYLVNDLWTFREQTANPPPASPD